MLTARFGPEVATLVETVTNPVYLPGQDKDEQYRAHVAASLAANPPIPARGSGGGLHRYGSRPVRRISPDRRGAPDVAW